MEKSALVFSLALLWILTSPQALSNQYGGASRYTGTALLAECNEVLTFAQGAAESQLQSNNQIGASYCMGMVNGMMALNAIYQARGEGSALFCPPGTPVTNIQGARLVVDYLETHPDQLEWDAGSLMYFAFVRAYPCEADTDE